MRVLLTGGEGFLGWHTRVRLRALSSHDVTSITRASWEDLPSAMAGIDAIIHIAGVNRGSAHEVVHDNVALAEDIARTVRASGESPTIVFANSIQAGNNSPYGDGKAQAASILAAVADQVGSRFVDVRLPNLFGEHGRPHYNSFVATFVDAVMNGRAPEITDRAVNLLHVQQAAETLTAALAATESVCLEPAGTPTSVQEVFGTLAQFNELYSSGDIPPLLCAFDIDLFNTLRAAKFPTHYPIPLAPREDHRGSLVEVVRVHGGQGQTFVSTTRGGITRGDHFHLRKVERFVVLKGDAQISLRKLFTDDVVTYDVNGRSPSIIDMPTMWVHNIRNVGDGELTTLFWTHELFDPAAPDTFPELVVSVPASGAESGL